MDYERLKTLANHFRNHPDQGNMGWWHIFDTPDINAYQAFLHLFGDYTLDEIEWPCGTTHCIAGMAQVLWPNDTTTLDTSMYSASEDAIKIIDLTEEQAEALFYTDDWLDQELVEIYHNTDKSDRGVVMADYIEYYIKHYKARNIMADYPETIKKVTNVIDNN